MIEYKYKNMLKATKENENTYVLKRNSLLAVAGLSVILIFVGVVAFVAGSDNDENRGLAMLFGAVIFATGVVLGLFAPYSKTYVFDKGTGQVKHESRRVVGAKNDTRPLSAVTRIRVEARRDMRSSRRGRMPSIGSIGKMPVSIGTGVGADMVYSYFLEMSEGKDMLLHRKRVRASILRREQGIVPEEIRQLGLFLNIPVDDGRGGFAEKGLRGTV